MNSDFAYSHSLTTFSQEGKLLQLEYATTAANRGKPVIAIHQNDYTIVVGLKRIEEQYDYLFNYENSNECPIHQITNNIYMAYSGLSSDARIIITEARKEAILYNSTYGEEISVNMLAKKVSVIYQEKTQEGGYRPFGCTVLIIDQNNLQSVEPSGNIFTLFAWAIGKEYKNIRKELKNKLLDEEVQQNISYDRAIVLAIQLLRQNTEIELQPQDFQILSIQKTNTHIFSNEEVRDYFNLND